MNWCNESVQVPLTYKTSITNVAFERFLFFMNCCYMFIQIAFIWKTLITKVAVQSLVSQILHLKEVSFLYELFSHIYSNCFYLKNSYHKSGSSVSALKRFLTFMNYFYMIFQIVLSEILELRLIHLFNIFTIFSNNFTSKI